MGSRLKIVTKTRIVKIQSELSKDTMSDINEAAVRKLLHRKLKDITVSAEFRNFFITLLCLVAIIYYLRGAPNYRDIRTREKISVRKLMSACIDVAEMGGKEEVKIREKKDIGERSKGQTREGANDPVTDGDMLSHRIMYWGLRKSFPNLRVVSEEHEAWEGEVALPRLDHEGLREDTSILGGEIELERLTVWVDPLDATQEYTENLTKYVTVMVGIAVDGRAIGGVIHKPFSNETIWSWRRQRNHLLNHLHILDEVELNRVYPEDEGPRVIVSRSHKGEVNKMVEKFNPPGVVTPAGGAGYKIWEIAAGHEDVYVHSSLIKKWDLCAGAAILNTLGGRITDAEGNNIDFTNEWEYRHEGGIVAAKYDQPGYVQALKLIRKHEGK